MNDSLSGQTAFAYWAMSVLTLRVMQRLASRRFGLDLVEAMLDYVYVFTAKYEEFQSRRQLPGKTAG